MLHGQGTGLVSLQIVSVKVEKEDQAAAATDTASLSVGVKISECWRQPSEAVISHCKRAIRQQTTDY